MDAVRATSETFRQVSGLEREGSQLQMEADRTSLGSVRTGDMNEIDRGPLAVFSATGRGIGLRTVLRIRERGRLVARVVTRPGSERLVFVPLDGWHDDAFDVRRAQTAIRQGRGTLNL